MSLERAYINCERCYNIVNSLKELSRHTKSKNEKLMIYQNKQVYSARNEAMKALESLRQIRVPIPEEIRESIGSEIFEESDTAKIALKACMTCIFSKPCIADIIKKEYIVEECDDICSE